ncbi:hypothetical protein [Ornithinimicrobium kibberense]|uniref:hypothetical protein n=1 Tax=Ornithinimicrobium kibberense TaxID=282060 RepID=UPI00360AEBB9
MPARPDEEDAVGRPDHDDGQADRSRAGQGQGEHRAEHDGHAQGRPEGRQPPGLHEPLVGRGPGGAGASHRSSLGLPAQEYGGRTTEGREAPWLPPPSSPPSHHPRRRSGRGRCSTWRRTGARGWSSRPGSSWWPRAWSGWRSCSTCRWTAPGAPGPSPSSPSWRAWPTWRCTSSPTPGCSGR